MKSWGIAIGGAVLQNLLRQQLPESFTSQLPAGIEVAYAAIPLIPALQEPLQSQVRAAFAFSTRRLWQILIGISGVGLLSVGLMSEIPMRSDVVEQWGLQERQRATEEDNVH